jgi:mannose/fructose/N-acetylgalactosamine-specific phosphotransferase system component IIC
MKANKTLGTLQKTGQNSRLLTHLRYFGYCIPLPLVFFAVNFGAFISDIYVIIFVFIPIFILSGLLSSIIYAKKYKLSKVLHFSFFSAGTILFCYAFSSLVAFSGGNLYSLLEGMAVLVFLSPPFILLGIIAIIYSFLSTRQKNLKKDEKKPSPSRKLRKGGK